MDDEDKVYFSDLDEIWKPQEIVDDRIYKLKQLNYCYYLNQRSSENWIGTIVGKLKTFRSGGGFNRLRANTQNHRENSGWHFTNMGGADQIRLKLSAYDHQEFNRPEIKDNIEQKMQRGEDYVGRGVDWQGKRFSFWEDESEWPQYLKDNREKYAHLLKPH